MGFGGYYGYAVNTFSTPGYYTAVNKNFIEGKFFDLKTDEILFSIQSRATNPLDIEKSSKKYTETLMEDIKDMKLQKK